MTKQKSCEGGKEGKEMLRHYITKYEEDGQRYAASWLAGYRVSSDRVASVEGHKLLRNPKIKNYIDNSLKVLESKKIVDQDENFFGHHKTNRQERWGKSD